MTERTPTETTNLDRYGHAALPWSRALDAMVNDPPEALTTWFLGSTRPGGLPHAIRCRDRGTARRDPLAVHEPIGRRSRCRVIEPDCVASARRS
jgi:hypothetical protein